MTEMPPPTEGLLPRARRAMLEAALRASLEGSGGDADPDRLEELLPRIDRFGDILADAWEALGGDAGARARLAERLDALAPPGAPADGGAGLLDGRRLRALRSKLKARLASRPAVPPVVPRDSAGLLLMAAIHVSWGDAAILARRLGAVLGELDTYERLRPLLAEASGSLAGHAASREALRALLDWRRAAETSGGTDFDLAGDGLPEDPAAIETWILATESLLACKPILNTPAFEAGQLFHKVTASPASVCGGDLLTLTGKGFGTVPGTVRFHAPPGQGQQDILSMGASSYWDAVPQSWTDTKITVIVPPLASCGTFAIRIPTGPVKVNGKTAQTFRAVGPFTVGGTRPEILALTADGVAGDLVVGRGALVKLSWLVCPDDSAVSLSVTQGGLPLWDKTGLAVAGSDILPVGGTQTTDYVVTLTAKTACGTVTRTLTVTVHETAEVRLDAIEITQATQFFWGGTTLAKTVNQVPLISGKATLARVYLATDQDPSFNNGEIAGASVTLRGWFEAGGELPGSPLSPVNQGPVTAGVQGIHTDRRDLARTANFLLPKSWMLPGPSLRLRAEVSLPATSPDAVDPKNKTAEIKGVRFHVARPLDVVIVLVDYTGACSAAHPGCNGPPALADAVKTLYAVRRVYPTDAIRVWLPEPGDRVLKFARDKSCGVCGSFGCLIHSLEDIAKGYDNDDDLVWWGAVKDGVGGPGGCGSASRSYAWGYAASRVGDDPVAWHEFGHAYGRAHSFEDGNYPAYGYADSDSIGEVGVDVELLTPFTPATANGHLYDPEGSSDHMSYDDPPIRLWTSPYTYMGLMQGFFAKKASGAGLTTSLSGAKPRRHRQERLFVCGEIWRETGEVSLRPLYHAEVYPKDARGVPSGFELALVDSRGRTLLAVPVRVPADGARDADGMERPTVRISQSLRFDEAAAALEVRRDGDVLRRVERPGQAPDIGAVRIEHGKEGWTLSWASGHPEEARLLHGVCVTCDDGARWARLAQGFRERSLRIDPGDLAGGERCRFRVHVTDGFNTRSAESETFALPVRPPLVVPVAPADGSTLHAFEPVRLAAEAISPRFGSLGDAAIRWESSLQGALGTGRELWVTLREGKHRLTVRAGTDPESEAEAALRVTVRHAGPQALEAPRGRT